MNFGTKMRHILLVHAGLAVAMIAPPAAAQTALFSDAQRADGEAQVRTAGQALASSLRDPGSAVFRNVFLQKTLGRDGKEWVSVCGEANSRNGFGGMSGFHFFMLVGSRVYVGGPGQIINADEICTNGRGVIDNRDYSPELRLAFADAGGK